MTTTVHYERLDSMVAQLGQDAPELKQAFILHRPSFAHVQINLDAQQTIVADAGTLMWKDEQVAMDTGCFGGCGAAYCRTCAGESCCQNKYTGPGQVAFGMDLPGDMLPFRVAPGQGWVMSDGAFVAATDNVLVSARFPGCGVACCSGEGLFLTHITAPSQGTVYCGGYGAIQRHDVPAGKVFVIHSGLFFACSDQTEMEVGLTAGCYTCCFGGEGFAMKFKGPCAVWTQNRDPAIIKAMLNPYKNTGAGASNGAAAGAGAAAAV